ncbi:MAG: POTRA domain-containing protein, partial [Patescibacteria group bacterium]
DLLQEQVILKPGEYFNPIKAQSDLSRFYNTGVINSATYNVVRDSSGDIKVQYIIEENPVIESIEITGNSVFIDYTLTSRMETKVGEILDNEKLRRDIKMIETLYHDNEYIMARVKEVDRPNTSDKKKVLSIIISEVRVGQISIKGNKNTKDFTILREMEMKPGLVFDRDMLQSDLRNVYNLNYFKTVYPDVKPSLLNEEDIDIVLNVEEKKTNSINFGGGYGQLDGWFGFIDLFLDNLWGEGQSALLKAQMGQLRNTYQLRYTNPWAFPDHTAFTGKIWSTYGYSYLGNYIEQRGGWDLGLSKPLSRHVQGSVHVIYEDVSFPGGYEQDGKQISPEYRRGVGGALAYDTRDYIMNPTQGDYHVFRLDKLATWFGGTVDSWKYGVSFEKFFPLEKIDKKNFKQK